MGFLKSSASELISCDNVFKVVASIAGSNLTVQITYKNLMTASPSVKLAETKLVYTSGNNNEMELTAGEYQKIFADAVASMSEASGSAVSLPTVNNKVTATGAIVGAVAPTVTYVLSGAIT